MYQNILAPIDGSATSNRSLQEALQIALMTHGRVRLLHVVDEISFTSQLKSYRGYLSRFPDSLHSAGAAMLNNAVKLATAVGVECDVVLHDNLLDSVHALILEEARRWPADLIVLGTHGRRGLSRLWLGSTAEKVLRLSSVPVILVPAPEEGALEHHG